MNGRLTFLILAVLASPAAAQSPILRGGVAMPAEGDPEVAADVTLRAELDQTLKVGLGVGWMGPDADILSAFVAADAGDGEPLFVGVRLGMAEVAERRWAVAGARLHVILDAVPGTTSVYVGADRLFSAEGGVALDPITLFCLGLAIEP